MRSSWSVFRHVDHVKRWTSCLGLIRFHRQVGSSLLSCVVGVVAIMLAAAAGNLASRTSVGLGCRLWYLKRRLGVFVGCAWAALADSRRALLRGRHQCLLPVLLVTLMGCVDFGISLLTFLFRVFAADCHRRILCLGPRLLAGSLVADVVGGNGGVICCSSPCPHLGFRLEL
ncbi:hypothetical conserved protein (plasmid) [Rhizobium etli CFN 42]|uniref:Hypothetical conserved protein n=1 Tax=Rhizobium etli (strain ATCC 51251 / DSM 11541 / JCM 21823 / NBRC 15573 / CFN 42) TaxID=347834 RepID=Q2JZ36_RHIEC|nr:hypothetical conserved protein [Rhizobium etli CFN 42]